VIATATVAVGGGMFTLIDAATATNKGPAVEAADESVTLNFSLAPTSAVVAKCMPAATVRVRVRLLEEKTGRDVLQVDARGLRPNTAFTVFLVEEPNDPSAPSSTSATSRRTGRAAPRSSSARSSRRPSPRRS
jgi:hypothetical protein